MEELEAFELDDDKNSIGEKESFKSDLGDFTHLQDRIIRFGQSNKMLLLTGLMGLGFLLTTTSLIILLFADLTIVYNGQAQNQNWIKILFIIPIALALLLPLGFVYMTYGARKLRTQYILRGVNTIETFIKINVILLVISGIFFAIFSLILFFLAFIFGVILILVLGAFYYYFYKLVGTSKDVLHDISSAFTSNNNSNHYPEATKLNVFFIIMLILSSLGFLLSLVPTNEPVDELTQSLQSAFNSIDMIGSVNAIISIIVLILALYVTTQFDQFIRVARPPKPYDYNDTMRDDTAVLNASKQTREDEWRLK